MVEPFVAGFYDGEKVITLWDEDCVARQVEWIKDQRESYTIYAHNGGRFDFFYYIKYFSAEAKIINGRIIQAKMGKHEFRDSYAIMPFALADYEKDVIDYEKFRKKVRNKHKDEILKYLTKDLTALYELVVMFHREFGDKLTIGSASMAQLKTFHKFSKGSEEYDKRFRTDFYFGGRNQVIKPGITEGDIRIYDVNSMYPFVMSTMLHPIGTGHRITRNIEPDTCFIVAEGRNYGAFPMRQKNNSLDFTKGYGTYWVSIHEWQAAIDTGFFKPTKILKCYNWPQRGNFTEFIDHFYQARLKAKAKGDRIREIFYKFILNSAYGKFAQNPNNYFDWSITPYGDPPPEWHECVPLCDEKCRKKWTMVYIHDGEYVIWKRPLQRLSWYNIAIGASITGAARSLLIRGLHATKNPLYVDTDSIICVGDSSVPIDDIKLGAWKCEGTGRVAAIAGKKMYAVFSEDVEGLCAAARKKGKPDPEIFQGMALAKKAHKGAKLTGTEIVEIARGAEVDSYNPVPSFKWDGTHTFTKRRIRSTNR